MLSNTKYEVTKNWDCGGSDIEAHRKKRWDGSDEAKTDLKWCAARCAALEGCHAFNFSQPNGNGHCWLKRNYRKSVTHGDNCGVAGNGYHYFTKV
jgi:hypothetical protein